MLLSACMAPVQRALYRSGVTPRLLAHVLQDHARVLGPGSPRARAARVLERGGGLEISVAVARLQLLLLFQDIHLELIDRAC